MPTDSRHARRDGLAPERREEPIRTAGEVLSDGQVVELVRAPNCASPRLLVYDGRKATIARMARVAGRNYVPAEVEASILRGVRLPPRSEPYGSTRDLFDAVAGVFRKYCGLGEKQAGLATYFAFATHFVDLLPRAPCLLMTGPDSAQAACLLRVLGALCRHAMLLAGISPGGLDELPTSLRPTLLFHLPEQNVPAERLLHTSHLPGFGVLGKCGLQEFAFAKAVYLGQRASRDSWANDCVRIPLAPPQGRTPTLDRRTDAKLTAEFQSKFLTYRINKYASVRNAQFDVAEFTGPTRELARCLGACVVGDAELQSGVIARLRPQDEAVRVERSMQLEYVIVEALLVLCHEKRDRVYVGEVTELVNGILSGGGEAMLLNAREVGAKLRSLNLFTERDATGYAFRLLNENRSRVHELARAYDVPSVQEGVNGCAHCAASMS